MLATETAIELRWLPLVTISRSSSWPGGAVLTCSSRTGAGIRESTELANRLILCEAAATVTNCVIANRIRLTSISSPGLNVSALDVGRACG